MLKIFGRKDSINVMKVLWTCEEMSLPFERVDVGGRFGFAAVPEYAGLNPNARVPTIDDDGVVLWESNAIVRYLASRYGDGRLLGEGAARWVAEQWMDWQQTTLFPPMRDLFFQLVRTPVERRDATLVQSAHAAAVGVWSLLDAQLCRGAFVAGDRFGMGDVPLGCMAYRWYAFEGIERPALPHLERWLGRLRERPGYRKYVMLPLV